MEQQPVLIILAGGKGSRLGEIGAVVPKSLFPVFDEPLLFRQIRQSLKADFQKIYISTRKEYIEQFGQGINNFFPNDKDKIAVVENAAHDKGVLYALLNLVQITGVSEALISLGDIYFLENPFLNFKQSSLAGVKVFAMRPQDKRDLSLGGIVFNQRNKLVKIEKKALRENVQGLKWSGLFSVTQDSICELEKFLLTNGQSTVELHLEDYLEFCRNRGIKFKVLKCPDFVNANTIDELFLASLFRVSEVYPQKHEAAGRLTSAAKFFRKDLISRRLLLSNSK